MDMYCIKRNLLQSNKAKEYYMSMLLNTIGNFKQVST